MQSENLISDEHKVPRMSLPEGLRFVGNAACSNCHHKKIYDAWKGFSHGRAMETLVKINRQYDPECVSCHSVGMYYYGGFRGLEQTPQLADVGCESCHGPGSDHIEQPGLMYQEIFTPCQECHNDEHSIKFFSEREEYFQKVRHWYEEPRKYWH
jgi:hypothetical protein